MTLPGAQDSLTLLSLACAYCASFTLSAKAIVFRSGRAVRRIVCSLSSCLGGVCPESQAAPPFDIVHNGQAAVAAVMRSGVFTVSAIRNPQIDEEKKSRMDGKKSADGQCARKHWECAEDDRACAGGRRTIGD